MSAKLKYCGNDLRCSLTTMDCIDDLEEISYTTHGILVADQIAGEVIWQCGDISTNRTYVEGLVRLLERGVAELHIKDMVEDYLHT